MELRSILTSTSVGELTLKSRRNYRPDTTIAAAATEMREESHGSALVCSEDGTLIGIFTERDLLRVVSEGTSLETLLADVMTKTPHTLTTESSLLEATQSMDQGGYRRLPVVDGTGSLVGIVDVKTIVHFLVEHFSAAVYNQASHSQLTARNREGA